MGQNQTNQKKILEKQLFSSKYNDAILLKKYINLQIPTNFIREF